MLLYYIYDQIKFTHTIIVFACLTLYTCATCMYNGGRGWYNIVVTTHEVHALNNMAALRGQFRALSNDRNLRRFVVQARPTGRQLGTGSYGTVEEVHVYDNPL